MPDPLGDITQSHVISVDFQNVKFIHWGVSYVSAILLVPKPLVSFHWHNQRAMSLSIFLELKDSRKKLVKK